MSSRFVEPCGCASCGEIEYPCARHKAERLAAPSGKGPHNWTDQQPFQATAELCAAPWGGFKGGTHFRCSICGGRFKPGDTVRWVYCNDGSCPGGNFWVCQACDGPDVKAKRAEWVCKFGWMLE
jgi:hypothetical protein